MDFLVTWSIDITADTPEEAAREAWRYLRKEDSTANVFVVFGDAMEPVHVDLTEIGIAGDLRGRP